LLPGKATDALVSLVSLKSSFSPYSHVSACTAVVAFEAQASTTTPKECALSNMVDRQWGKQPCRVLVDGWYRVPASLGGTDNESIFIDYGIVHPLLLRMMTGSLGDIDGED
jgi:hypothetical protein